MSNKQHILQKRIQFSRLVRIRRIPKRVRRGRGSVLATSQASRAAHRAPCRRHGLVVRQRQRRTARRERSDGVPPPRDVNERRRRSGLEECLQCGLQLSSGGTLSRIFLTVTSPVLVYTEQTLNDADKGRRAGGGKRRRLWNSSKPGVRECR